MKLLSFLILTVPCFTQTVINKLDNIPGYVSFGRVPFLAGGPVFPNLTLGAHAHTDNDVASSATVVVNITPLNTGSAIACAIKFSALASFVSITDNVNSGKYLPLASMLREPNHNYVGGIYYHENVAASPTTITLTYSLAETHGQMACIEVQGVPLSYSVDSSYVASQAATTANPVTGTTLTPFSDGSFILNTLIFDSGTTTSGSGYTLIENAGSNSPVSLDALYPEYNIQTTKTASNGPYTNATATNAYADLMGAFAKQQSGSCGASIVIDWHGGTNGASTANADLQASVYGDPPQANADRCFGCNGGPAPGVWANVGTVGVTYSTIANQPLQTARNCSYGKFPATTTLGLSIVTPNPNGPTLAFETTSPTVTGFGCFMTDTPVSHTGTFDLWRIGVNDNSDFVLIQVNSNGAVGVFNTEMPTGTVSTPAVNWVANTWYGIRITEAVGGTNKAEFYTYSGSGCSGTPTLIGTQSGPHSASTLPSNEVTTLGGGADTYAAGTHFYQSAIILDTLYGSSTIAY